MNEMIFVAFVGAGGHATTALYPQLHKVPDLDLVAVCDLDREKAEGKARWFGARHDLSQRDGRSEVVAGVGTLR